MLPQEQIELMSADLQLIYSDWCIECMTIQNLYNCWIAFKANEEIFIARINKKKNK